MTEKHTPFDPNIDRELLEGDSLFRGQLLLAMPALENSFFDKSVVYICAHSAAGAMGIVINQRLMDVQFDDLLEQLDLPQSNMRVSPIVHFGGPVETGRGFVLHSTDFLHDDTVKLQDNLAVTGTVDILRAISEGKGPNKSIFALGYAGWGPGQLEAEMQENAWLTTKADMDLVFCADLNNKWEMALAQLGVSPIALSMTGGQA